MRDEYVQPRGNRIYMIVQHINKYRRSNIKEFTAETNQALCDGVLAIEIFKVMHNVRNEIFNLPTN